jgi:hypothetical protein
MHGVILHEVDWQRTTVRDQSMVSDDPSEIPLDWVVLTSFGLA